MSSPPAPVGAGGAGSRGVYRGKRVKALRERLPRESSLMLLVAVQHICLAAHAAAGDGPGAKGGVAVVVLAAVNAACLAATACRGSARATGVASLAADLSFPWLLHFCGGAPGAFPVLVSRAQLFLVLNAPEREISWPTYSAFVCAQHPARTAAVQLAYLLACVLVVELAAFGAAGEEWLSVPAAWVHVVSGACLLATRQALFIEDGMGSAPGAPPLSRRRVRFISLGEFCGDIEQALEDLEASLPNLESNLSEDNSDGETAESCSTLNSGSSSGEAAAAAAAAAAGAKKCDNPLSRRPDAGGRRDEAGVPASPRGARARGDDDDAAPPQMLVRPSRSAEVAITLDLPARENSGTISSDMCQVDPSDIATVSVALETKASRKRFRGDEPITWRKGTLLGQGAFGCVHIGASEKTGDVVAVKTISFTASDPDAPRKARLLQREATVLQRLCHGNLVQYYTAEATEVSVSIYMEYVAGGALASVVKQFGPVAFALGATFMRQILFGLRHLHSRGIVHRDLKCSNVMLTVDGVCKLSDYGISCMAHMKRESFAGAPMWTAPEVLRGDPHSFESDIWSAGATCLELLSGVPPFSFLKLTQFGALSYLVDTDMEVSAAIPDELHASASSFILSCLQRSPGDRPTATDLLHDPFIKSKHSITPDPPHRHINDPNRAFTDVMMHSVLSEGSSLMSSLRSSLSVSRPSSTVFGSWRRTMLDRDTASKRSISVPKALPSHKSRTRTGRKASERSMANSESNTMSSASSSSAALRREGTDPALS